MSLGIVGQRCLSEREPELGLGMVSEVEHARITVEFPATSERRIYARGTAVLKRVQFGVGETVTTHTGASFTIETVSEEDGLLVYGGGGQSIREDRVSALTSVSSPAERLMAGQADPSEVFSLRQRTLRARTQLLQSPVRGFLGGRIDLIPHQFYILNEVSGRQNPRVLLSDEVGLGKTIEAGLILQRLLTTGRASRVLILVPESLVHQWFVELLRRFNLWFTLFDEAHCLAIEAAEPDKNPLLSAQLVLMSTAFPVGQETRAAQIVEAGWDLAIVDEAHHLNWSPEGASPEYQFVERIARKTPGLLLLTATPNQLGVAGHFARLHLLDPDRYADLESFLDEMSRYEAVAEIAEKIVEQKPLAAKDQAKLRKLFDRDPAVMETLLADLAENKAGAHQALLRTLLDQHGTGRVVFRNTRAAMANFPRRRYLPAIIEDSAPECLAKMAQELEAEESDNPASIRYDFSEDPRIEWLVALLKKTAPEKILLICRNERKVLAIEAAIKARLNTNIGLFHEGLPLVQRDRQAAWFAEPDGARILLCSEIGSEGRNFQFAHHLVLFDLPLNPGLVEQRIGRLDRIGQAETIKIHVPVLKDGANAVVADWYHRGLNAFEAPLHGGNDYMTNFRVRLLELAVGTAKGKLKAKAAEKKEVFIAETIRFREALLEKLRKGRDRLLELNSFNPEVANAILDRVRAADADPLVHNTLSDLFDHFGVLVQEEENGDMHIDASRAYVEGFPSVPPGGLLATYQRRRAIAREDMTFISADHSIVRDSIDLLIDSPAGTTAFCVLEADKPNLLLEAVFILETVADTRWQVDQFLAPTPLRVLVDIHGNDLTGALDYEKLERDVEDAPLSRFLEKPGFNGTLLKNLVEGATDRAKALAEPIRAAARARAAEVLTSELQRLVDLRKLNPSVRAGEIELAKKRVRQTRTAIEQARLRLDSIRLIVEGVDIE